MQSSQIMFGFVTSFLDAPSGTAQTQMTPSDSPPLTMAPAVPLKCFNRPGGENLRAPTAPWCAPADTTRVTRMQSKSIDFAIFRLQARVCGAHMREQGAAREDFCFEVVGSHTINFRDNQFPLCLKLSVPFYQMLRNVTGEKCSEACFPKAAWASHWPGPSPTWLAHAGQNHRSHGWPYQLRSPDVFGGVWSIKIEALVGSLVQLI